jgi:hypothetical protein
LSTTARWLTLPIHAPGSMTRRSRSTTRAWRCRVWKGRCSPAGRRFAGCFLRRCGGRVGHRAVEVVTRSASACVCGPITQP